jgi:hypothetical protein
MMSKVHGKARSELERTGADPNTDAPEGKPREDMWFGRDCGPWRFCSSLVGIQTRVPPFETGGEGRVGKHGD